MVSAIMQNINTTRELLLASIGIEPDLSVSVHNSGSTNDSSIAGGLPGITLKLC